MQQEGARKGLQRHMKQKLISEEQSTLIEDSKKEEKTFDNAISYFLTCGFLSD